jgi:hypothetical protein
VKHLLLVLLMLAAAALLFADGEPSRVATAVRQMSQLAVQEQVRETVQSQEAARVRVDPLEDPAQPKEAPARWQVRSGDGDCDYNGDGAPDRDRDRDRLRDGTGDGVPDRDRTGQS